MFHKAGRANWAILALVVVFSPPAFAQPAPPAAADSLSSQNQSFDSTQPSVTMKRFGDWEVSCSIAAPSDCTASQRLIAKETGQVVFATTILPNKQSKRNDAFVGIVSVPLGGYLAPGMQLSIDKGKPYKILFETCNASGCHAGFPIEGAVLAALRKGKIATFRVWANKAKPAEVAVSLSGLPEALGALIGQGGKQ